MISVSQWKVSQETQQAGNRFNTVQFCSSWWVNRYSVDWPYFRCPHRDKNIKNVPFSSPPPPLFHLQGSVCSLLRLAWPTPPGSAWSVSARLLRPTRCACWLSSVGQRPRSSTTSAWLWCCPPKTARSLSPPRRSCCRPTVRPAPGFSH